jgi:hypothetical protein
MTAQTCPQSIELEDPLPLFEDRSNQEVKTTTCYMCACRCGIKVTLEGKKVRYIQGNRNHPVNKGVLCAKGNAGIMKHESMAKLRSPLRRKPGTERGAGEFGFDVSPAKVLILRYSSLIFMVIIPAYSLWSQELNFNTLLTATFAYFLGAILERWLFFTEAKHVVNLCYGREA